MYFFCKIEKTEEVKVRIMKNDNLTSQVQVKYWPIRLCIKGRAVLILANFTTITL